jgi:hypothetical protein
MVMLRPKLPRPDGPLDPEMEAKAAAALARARARAPRRHAPPQAGAVAQRIVAPILSQAREKTIDELRRQWPEIVGEKLAQLTCPEKLGRNSAGRVLTLKVAGPAAPFVQHQQALILERCNLAGADLKGLAIVQGALARPKTQANVRPLSQPLSAAEEQALAAALADIANPRLREALMRLGRAVSAQH